MEEFRVVVAGGRDFDNFELLRGSLDWFLQNKITTHKVIIVSGCARGADTLGERYAVFRRLEIEHYPADWDKYGSSAGYRRNKQMAQVADVAVIFWDGVSRGSANMIKEMDKLNKPYRVIDY